jgi:hypothetical protein
MQGAGAALLQQEKVAKKEKTARSPLLLQVGIIRDASKFTSADATCASYPP